MSFLKKHYEKIILVFFLLVFLFTLIQLLLIVKQSRRVGLDDLKFEVKSPDYPKIDVTKYDIAKLFERDVPWKKISSRKIENLVYTDLMNPYQAGQCPSCKSIIPLIDFEKRKCSVCEYPLTPLKRDSQLEAKERDTDKDGLADEKELELGLNPNDPNDIYLDSDKDGFSNIFEVNYGTNINDTKNHPPLAYRLFVNRIERKKLNFEVKKINRKGEDDKTKWDIQTIEWIPEKQKRDEKWRKIGNEILIDGTKYKIIDIIPKTVEREDHATKYKSSEDQSEVIIQAEGEEPIVVKQKAPVFENRETVELIDVFTKQKFRLALNEKFSISTPGTETSESYILSKIVNREVKTVEIISDDDKKQKFEIGPQPIEAVKEKVLEQKPSEGLDTLNINF